MISRSTNEVSSGGLPLQNSFYPVSGTHVIEAHFTVGSEEKIVELTLTAQ